MIKFKIDFDVWDRERIYTEKTYLFKNKKFLIRKIYERVYIKNDIWTPFCILKHEAIFDNVSASILEDKIVDAGVASLKNILKKDKQDEEIEEFLKEDIKKCNENPTKDSQFDFQKFRENCLKDCVNEMCINLLKTNNERSKKYEKTSRKKTEKSRRA